MKISIEENDPKIYAMILETKEVTFLSIQYASSLEEAFSMARVEFERTSTQFPKGHPMRNLSGAKINLFTINLNAPVYCR